MSDWIYGLSFPMMAAIVALMTLLITIAIHFIVQGMATGERLRVMKGVSPGLLPPLGIIFALLVGFISAQVWRDTESARLAVNHEASALRAVVLLARVFPREAEGRLRALVAGHIDAAVKKEWPAMSHQRVTLTMIPSELAQALHYTLELRPDGPGQATAQREIVASLQTALDARRQRIIVSRSSLDRGQWWGLVFLAIVTLVAIACVHSDNRSTAALALGLFATAVALALLLIASHTRPFAGPVPVGPDLLLQVLPAGESRQ
jgi:hypothetical protein